MKEELMKNLHSKQECKITTLDSLQISITPQEPDFIKTATEWLNKGVEQTASYKGQNFKFNLSSKGLQIFKFEKPKLKPLVEEEVEITNVK